MEDGMGSDFEYRPWTAEEWAEHERQMDVHRERSAAEHEAREREEYEKARPLIESAIAELNRKPALLPSPWLRMVGLRDRYPTDWYEATAGPFRIEITHDYVDDEDGGWSTWRWDVRDERHPNESGVYGDNGDIRRAAREAVESCREDFDDAPEAFAELVVLAAVVQS
jgi:hypothetical protein